MAVHTTSVNEVRVVKQDITIRRADDKCVNVTVGSASDTKVSIMASRAIIEKSIISMYPDAVVIMGGATPPSQTTIDALVAEGYQLDNILFARTS